MVTVIGPLETASQHFTLAFDYHPDAAVPFAHTAHTDPYRGANATMDTGCFTDGLGRMIQTTMTSTLFQGASQKALDETVVSGRVAFDQVGRVVRKYYPTTEPGTDAAPGTLFNNSYDLSAPPVTLTYDVLNRPVTTFYPDGSSENFTYSIGANGPENEFLTSFTDEDGNKRQTYKDVKELVREEVEYVSPSAAVTTQYQYDPLEELTRVTDAGGNLTNITYDLLGRRTAVQNPDSGKTSFTYDLASNLIRKVTANLAKENKVVSYGYDFTRLQTVTYPDFPRNNAVFTFGLPGAPLNQAGRIASIKDASGSLALAYDAMGNPVTETRVIQVPSGGQWPGEAAWDQGTAPTSPVTYVTGFLWDDWDRVQQMTYPDGEVLTYQYDAGGRPRAVAGIVPASGSSQASGGVFFPYVSRVEYDRFGSPVFRQNGNGTQGTYAYRSDNRRLSNLSSLSGGVTFQNLNYGYDAMGNIQALVNSAATGEGGLAAPVTQGFQYDGLYRLSKANGLYSGAFNTGTGANFNSQYSLSMTYDNLHNITEKNQQVQQQVPGQGFQPDNSLTYDWTYQYKGAQPHAPSAVGTRAFTYDANGNQAGFTDLSGTSRTILWDEDDQMEAVEDGAGALSDGGIRFTYDASGTRVLKIDHSSKITAYPNQFFTAQDPLAGSAAQADKHIFIGQDRIATHMVSGPVSTAGGAGNPSTSAQWIGSWGVSIAAGDTDALNFGSPGNFVTVQQDNVPVLGQPEIWTKGEQVIGTANSCQVLTLINPKPQGGYFEVSFNNQPGYIPVNTAVVGIPTACLQSSTTSQTTSLMPQNSFVFFYHDDHLGSTGYLTDQNGTLSEHIEYLPFGETWTQQNRGTQIFPDYEFTGQELDTETGLYYFGARYYDPRTSLWQSADPMLADGMGLQEPRMLSAYSYSFLNPLNVTDPDGNEPRIVVLGGFMVRVNAVAEYLRSEGFGKNVVTFTPSAESSQEYTAPTLTRNVTTLHGVMTGITTGEAHAFPVGKLKGDLGAGRGMKDNEKFMDEILRDPNTIIVHAGVPPRPGADPYNDMEKRVTEQTIKAGKLKAKIMDFAGTLDLERDPQTNRITKVKQVMARAYFMKNLTDVFNGKGGKIHKPAKKFPTVKTTGAKLTGR
jgi:RHS repeat-associated protein